VVLFETAVDQYAHSAGAFEAERRRDLVACNLFFPVYPGLGIFL
jgi:hypothetical protein